MFGRFQAAEGRLAQKRSNTSGDSATRAFVVAGAGLAGLVALVFLLTRYLRRALSREERALLEAQAAQARLSVLARASEVLAGSLDYQRTLEQVAFIAVPAVADWCSVDLVAEDGSLQNVAVGHVDPSKGGLARELQNEDPTDPDAPTGTPNVIRTGRPEGSPERPDKRPGAE